MFMALFLDGLGTDLVIFGMRSDKPDPTPLSFVIELYNKAICVPFYIEVAQSRISELKNDSFSA